MRQLVDEGGASFDGPELRGDGYSVGAGDGHPQSPGRSFGFGESAQERRRAFFGLPTGGIDRFVFGPQRRIELGRQLHFDFAGLALQGGAELAWPRGQVFGEASARHGQHVIDIAWLNKHQPARAAQSSCQLGSFAALIGQRAEDQVRGFSGQIRRQCSQQRRAIRLRRNHRYDPEVVPVGQRVNPAAFAHQRQNRAVFTLFGNGEQRQDIAVLDQPLPPIDPVKRRTGVRRAGELHQRRIALHFFKIIVIDDRNHFTVPCPLEPQNLCLHLRNRRSGRSIISLCAGRNRRRR